MSYPLSIIPMEVGSYTYLQEAQVSTLLLSSKDPRSSSLSLRVEDLRGDDKTKTLVYARSLF